MSDLKLYRVRESTYGLPKDEKPAEAYVAATSLANALYVFVRHFGEVKDATVTSETLEFLMMSDG